MDKGRKIKWTFERAALKKSPSYEGDPIWCQGTLGLFTGRAAGAAWFFGLFVLTGLAVFCVFAGFAFGFGLIGLFVRTAAAAACQGGRTGHHQCYCNDTYCFLHFGLLRVDVYTYNVIKVHFVTLFLSFFRVFFLQ
jgi:hypothetical protein